MGWINLTQGQGHGGWALVNTVMNFCVPLNAGYFLTGTETCSLSSRLCEVRYDLNCTVFWNDAIQSGRHQCSEET